MPNAIRIIAGEYYYYLHGRPVIIVVTAVAARTLPYRAGQFRRLRKRRQHALDPVVFRGGHKSRKHVLRHVMRLWRSSHGGVLLSLLDLFHFYIGSSSC